jgi:zinc transporter 9
MELMACVGLEKLKNVAVLVPASLFLGFGAHTIYEAIEHVMHHGAEAAEAAAASGSSTTAMLMIAGSLTIETMIIFKNFLDASALLSDGQTKLTLSERLKSLFKKKDPLLEAVLYENFITLVSTSIPLLTSGMNTRTVPMTDLHV